MKYIKWGILGCSEETAPVARLLADIEGSQVVAVMNEQREVAKQFVSEFSSKWYTDVQELIDDTDVNAVYVATAPATHATYAILAMRSGKPVFVEAPLAGSYWDCVRMNRVSEETGIPCYVNYFLRYLPYYETVNRHLKNGTLGTVMSVDFRSTGIPFKLQGEESPNAHKMDMFWTMCAHQMDLLQHLFGIITEAWGVGVKDEHVLSACYKFETGLAGSALWTLSAPEWLTDDEVIVVGEHGQMRFSLFGCKPVTLRIGLNEEKIEAKSHGAEVETEHDCLPLLKEVVNDLQGFNVCSCTSISATPVHWVLDRIRER